MPLTQIDIFAWLYASYRKISAAQLQQNFEKLNTPVPSHLPITVIFKKIEDYQKFEILVKHQSLMNK